LDRIRIVNLTSQNPKTDLAAGESPEHTGDPSQAAPPNSFGEYLRSFGPGLVVVLTWLGAGDIVEMATAGADHGYSLMWVLFAAVGMRWVMVSVIARYQLCNPRGEHLLDGLCRLNRAYAPLLLLAAILFGHLYGSYMTRGIGEAFRNMTGVGTIWQWALFWNSMALVLVFRPAFQRLETLFKFFLVLLSVAFLGTAARVGFNPAGIARGLVSFEMPEQRGQFGPLLVAAGMIGAVGGSLMNLVYPYFLVSKGWRGPQFRRVQTYDFLLAMAVMLILDLAIWTLGAETLNSNGGTIATMDDLPWLLGTLLGRAGELLFYAGIFAAVFTSLVGHALGLGLLANHAWLRCQSTSTDLRKTDFRGGSLYRAVAAWCLISPLVWTLPGMPDFVALTLVVNAMQVVLLPLIAGGLWVLSSRARDIGDKHINRWWEHVVLGSLLTLAIWGAWGAITSTLTTVRTWGDDSPTPSQLAAGTALSQVSSAAIETSEEGHTITADFHGHPLSQQDLTRLRELDHLEQLDLSGTRITDADLRYLQGLGHLRKLTLLDLALSRPAIERLQRSLPACRIVTTTSGREP
jgi:Mn2+/Fe2+ NRAMP family transporter